MGSWPSGEVFGIFLSLKRAILGQIWRRFETKTWLTRSFNPVCAGTKKPITASVGSLSVQQLQDMIANTIRVQYGAPSQDTLMYSKPYTRRIDNLRMSTGYQPPKFQQFDGKGTQNNMLHTSSKHATMPGQRGNAFDWYTDLESESLDNWDQMEREFLNRFYSTRRTVSMMELTNTKQWKDEPVVDYINRWHSLSLDCKDRPLEM
ncbi:unnamed protein product [Prunus armeniaca]